MSWYQREPEVRLVARSQDVKDRRSAIAFVREGAILEATDIEVGMRTTTYAPTRSDGRRKPGTSDETTFEVLHTLSILDAETLAISLVRALTTAAAVVPPGKGLNIAELFGEQDLTPFDQGATS